MSNQELILMISVALIVAGLIIGKEQSFRKELRKRKKKFKKNKPVIVKIKLHSGEIYKSHKCYAKVKEKVLLFKDLSKYQSPKKVALSLIKKSFKQGYFINDQGFVVPTSKVSAAWVVKG